MRYLTSALALWLAFAPPQPPPSAKQWIDGGLNAEFAGDAMEAERHYLAAAALDRRYLPAWTLAAYYARRGESNKLRYWADRAARMQYDDPRPLIRLLESAQEISK